MNRVEENKETIQEVKDLYEGMIITSECSELRYINIVLMDISKSLAIIADKMVNAESEG